MSRTIEFPEYTGIRCLMMPYVQGDFSSVPEDYAPYREIIENVYVEKGDFGFLTIDESPVSKGNPHRGARAKYGRALHTEAGKIPNMYMWGGNPGYHWGAPAPSRQHRWGVGPTPGYWGGRPNVELERDVRVILANNLDGSCAIWDAEHEDTSLDGDIGHVAHMYPYEDAIFMKAGQVEEIGILTPHESLPVEHDFNRQFLRIISSGVHGREPYFTVNPKMEGRV